MSAQQSLQQATATHQLSESKLTSSCCVHVLPTYLPSLLQQSHTPNQFIPVAGMLHILHARCVAAIDMILCIVHIALDAAV